MAESPGPNFVGGVPWTGHVSDQVVRQSLQCWRTLGSNRATGMTATQKFHMETVGVTWFGKALAVLVSVVITAQLSGARAPDKGRSGLPSHRPRDTRNRSADTGKPEQNAAKPRPWDGRSGWFVGRRWSRMLSS